MDSWDPYVAVTAFMFAAYVLIAVFGSRENDREPAASFWSWLRRRFTKPRM